MHLHRCSHASRHLRQYRGPTVGPPAGQFNCGRRNGTLAKVAFAYPVQCVRNASDALLRNIRPVFACTTRLLIAKIFLCSSGFRNAAHTISTQSTRIITKPRIIFSDGELHSTPIRIISVGRTNDHATQLRQHTKVANKRYETNVIN
jgi:hypothetical protein